MPCYHFTWHAYGTWLPDRAEGSVHWSRGRQASSQAMATRYREQQRERTVVFSQQMQLDIISELVLSAYHASFRLHFVGTDTSHVHVPVSWKDERAWQQLRKTMRRSISLRLNKRRRRRWLSRGEDVKQVRTMEHLDYLTGDYLPSHRGWKWCERRGLFL